MSCAVPFQDFVWGLVLLIQQYVNSVENKTQVLSKCICIYCDF